MRRQREGESHSWEARARNSHASILRAIEMQSGSGGWSGVAGVAGACKVDSEGMTAAQAHLGVAKPSGGSPGRLLTNVME